MNAPTGRTRFLWKLRPYYRQVAGLLLVGSAGGILMNVAIVLPAVLLGRAVNVALAVERHQAAPAQVGWAALLFVAGTAATELPRIAKRYYLGVARTRFVASVRADALRGVLGWQPERSALMPVGDVMARVIGDVDVLGTGVGEVMVETWDTLLFSASLVVTMFLYDPGLAAVALAPVPPALWLAKRSGRMVAHRTTVARESEAELTGVLREQLGALRLLRLFGRIEAATGRVHRFAGVQAGAELATIRLDEALAAVYTALLSAGAVLIVWLGGERVVSGSMSVGALVAFLALFVRFVTRAPRIPQMANRVQAAGAAYRRLEALLAPPVEAGGEPRWSSFRSAHVPGISQPLSAPARPAAGPTGLRMMRASFAYPGSPVPAVLEVDLDVPPGALVAVTGPVGSGKSALARLAAGLYPPDTGTVEIDGRPVASALAATAAGGASPPAPVRRWTSRARSSPGNTISTCCLDPEVRAGTVGYLGQEPQVFSGTVAENITMWASSTPDVGLDPAASRAVRLAALEQDIAAMPAGPASEIGELGIRVSGGQRQRIALARALAAAGQVPGLLVLDDPFSAVDVHTETAIVAGLRAAFGPGAPEHQRATVLLFSHRLAAFPLADLVVVLDAGRVAETGTHAELVAAGGLYARIASAQARMEALDDVVGAAP